MTHTGLARVRSCARGPRDQLDFQVEGTSLYITLDSGEKPVKEMNVRILALFLGKTPELCFRWQGSHCRGPALSVADTVGPARRGFREPGEAHGAHFQLPLFRKL